MAPKPEPIAEETAEETAKKIAEVAAPTPKATPATTPAPDASTTEDDEDFGLKALFGDDAEATAPSTLTAITAPALDTSALATETKIEFSEEELTKKGIDVAGLEAAANAINTDGAALLAAAYDKKIKIDPKRTALASAAIGKIGASTTQEDLLEAEAILTTSEAQAAAAADTSFGAFCKTLSAGFTLLKGSATPKKKAEALAQCTKFAQAVGEKFGFLAKSDLQADKGQDAESLDKAFTELAASDATTANPAFATAVKDGHGAFRKELQDAVIAAKEDMDKSRGGPAPKAPEETKAAATPAAGPKTKDEVDPNTAATIKGVVTTAKFVGIAGAGIAVTVAFPPLGAALLIGAAIFFAYKGLSKKAPEEEKKEGAAEEVDATTAAEFVAAKQAAQAEERRFLEKGIPMPKTKEFPSAALGKPATPKATAAALDEMTKDNEGTQVLLVDAKDKIDAAALVANGLGTTTKGAAITPPTAATTASPLDLDSETETTTPPSDGGYVDVRPDAELDDGLAEFNPEVGAIAKPVVDTKTPNPPVPVSASTAATTAAPATAAVATSTDASASTNLTSTALATSKAVTKAKGGFGRAGGLRAAKILEARAGRDPQDSTTTDPGRS